MNKRGAQIALTKDACDNVREGVERRGEAWNQCLREVRHQRSWCESDVGQQRPKDLPAAPQHILDRIGTRIQVFP